MTLQATFCATLVDEWFRAGLRHAVIAPGSRSAPLAIALLTDRRVVSHVRLDERSAAFFALGIALDSATPTLVLTTSGTAASEVHAAVLEADLARVPLIVVTADRPFELHGVGAPQTVVQSGLFGSAVRFSADPGVAAEGAKPSWRSFASRLIGEASASPRGPGPVHVNLPFRDPLVGTPGALPLGRPDGRPWHQIVVDHAVSAPLVEQFVEAVERRRGVVVVGGPIGNGGIEAVAAFARRIRWPVLADPRAFPRGVDPQLVSHVDGIIGSEHVRAGLVPEVIVHLGSPHASKALGAWCAKSAAAGVPQILLDPFGAFFDPNRAADLVLRTDPVALLASASVAIDDARSAPAEWAATWRLLDDAAEAAIAEVIASATEVTEPEIARAVFAAAPPGSIIFGSSSMPVRDLEWFSASRDRAPTVLANRGANGIDGVTSTVLGVATSAAGRSGRVIALIGDLALLHDLSGLVFGVEETVPDATFVVVDNRGGGIFSFLTYPGVLDEATFERGFSTPQRPDLAATVRALGHTVVEVSSAGEVAEFVAREHTGIAVAIVRTERSRNVAFHAAVEGRIVAAVDSALDAALGTD